MQISDTSGRFSSIFFFSNFMLFCGDFGVNKIRIMGWKSSNLIG